MKKLDKLQNAKEQESETNILSQLLSTVQPVLSKHIRDNQNLHA